MFGVRGERRRWELVLAPKKVVQESPAELPEGCRAPLKDYEFTNKARRDLNNYVSRVKAANAEERRVQREKKLCRVANVHVCVALEHGIRGITGVSFSDFRTPTPVAAIKAMRRRRWTSSLAVGGLVRP